MTRRLLNRLLLAGVVAAAVVGAVTAAGAHSALLGSAPADGAVLDEAPAALELTYSEPPDPELSWVRVYDRGGAQLDVGELDPDAGDPALIRVALPDLPDGVYTVGWQALSAVDGHITTGAFTFAVGEVDLDDPAMAPAPVDEADHRQRPSPLAVTGRWVLYWGLALLLGWSASVLVVFRHDGPPGAAWMLLGCWLVAVVGLGLVALAEAASAEVSLWRLLGSATGARLVRLGAVLALVGIAAALAAWRRSRLGAAALAVLTAAAMFAHALAGHAGAPTDLRWLNLPAQWLHVVGVGAWIGGLMWLLAGIRGRREADRAVAVTRFSMLATVALGLVVVTGVVRAVTGVGSFESLWASDYGIALLVKLGLLVPLIGLGAVNRFRNVPALRRGEDAAGSLRHSVRGELLFAAAVFAVTGALAGLPPPVDQAMHEEHAAHAPPDPADERRDDAGVAVEGSDFATSVRVTLHVDPGLVGRNRFRVQVVDYDTGETIDADRVALEFTVPDQPDLGPARMELQPAAAGWWEGEGTTIALPARWRATVIIAHGREGLEVPLEFDIGAHEEDADHG